MTKYLVLFLKIDVTFATFFFNFVTFQSHVFPYSVFENKNMYYSISVYLENNTQKTYIWDIQTRADIQ